MFLGLQFFLFCSLCAPWYPRLIRSIAWDLQVSTKENENEKKKRTPTRSQEQKGKQVKRAFPTIAFVIHWRKKMDNLGMAKLTQDKQLLHTLADVCWFFYSFVVATSKLLWGLVAISYQLSREHNKGRVENLYWLGL